MTVLFYAVIILYFSQVAVIPITCVVFIVLAMILSHSHLAVKVLHYFKYSN